MCALDGRKSLETRIQIVYFVPFDSDNWGAVSYETLSGNIHNFPSNILGQSETTGAIWHITIRAGGKDLRFLAADEVWKMYDRTIPICFVKAKDHIASISEGEILKIISSPENIEQV